MQCLAAKSQTGNLPQFTTADFAGAAAAAADLCGSCRNHYQPHEPLLGPQETTMCCPSIKEFSTNPTTAARVNHRQLQ